MHDKEMYTSGQHSFCSCSGGAIKADSKSLNGLCLELEEFLKVDGDLRSKVHSCEELLKRAWTRPACMCDYPM